MNQYGLKFHHLGLATKDHARAIKFVSAMGYRVSEAVYDPNQEVMLVWCESDAQPNIELIYPTSNIGPLDNLLKAQEAMVYHMCFSSSGIEISVQRMKDDGLRIAQVSALKEAPLFSNKLVGFYFVKGVGLIEIVEEE